MRTLLNGKIHRARITAADVHYVGSITIDRELTEAAGILEYERVQVVDVDNGARLETYVIAGTAGSGTVQLNGAAAHLMDIGDRVIIMSYAQLEDQEARSWQPRVVLVDDQNHIVEVRRGVEGGVYGFSPKASVDHQVGTPAAAVPADTVAGEAGSGGHHGSADLERGGSLTGPDRPEGRNGAPHSTRS